MSLNVVIAPDKFKGTLTAAAAARAIASGWSRSRHDDSLELLPITDGGEGFGEILSVLLKARPVRVSTVDAAHRPLVTTWWWAPQSRTAIIESANVIGLAHLPSGQFHPFQLDTFGLGRVIRAAAAKGAMHLLIGIGGSATNDGGFGMMRALGWRFMAGDGGVIESWTELHRLSSVLAPTEPIRFKTRVVAVDVRNPLLGNRGATRIFGPQKGIQSSEFRFAEANLRQLAAHLSRTCAVKPGSGAAGGLGFGLAVALRAPLRSGFSIFAAHSELARRVKGADLVITGEGCIDHSSIMGKGTGELARRCRRYKVPAIALAGMIQHSSELNGAFTHLHAMTDLAPPEQTQSKPARWLAALAKTTAESMRSALPQRAISPDDSSRRR